MTADLIKSLQLYFGFSGFRIGQLEAIRNLLNEQHTLVVMPTGSGKSLVFQLTGLHRSGITLVISPLIALMKDQVDSLERRGIPATFINSTLSGLELNRRLKGMSKAQYRLVYVAPERLRSLTFLDAIRSQPVGLLAVDEAHCISEWGHDFRPDYLHIAKFRAALGNPLTVALTATATPVVQDDIVRLLGLSHAQRIVTGFNRPNLTLQVRSIASLPARFKALQNLLTPYCNEATIVYTGTRRDAEEVAEFVTTVLGITARHYHAGLPGEERTRIQDAFMTGSLSFVVATNAFGMGIDRPDVRQVVHYSLPGSLEAYYQEAGRAGRDGLPARATLLYSTEDRALQEWFIDNSEISSNDLHLLFDTLQSTIQKQEAITISNLSYHTGLQEVKVRVGLAELERAGSIEHIGENGLQMLVNVNVWKINDIQAVTKRLQQHQQHRKMQLQSMIDYAESNLCRRAILLKHFGDPSPAEVEVCCDNCTPRPGLQLPSKIPGQLSEMERVPLVLLDIVRRLKPSLGREKVIQILKGSRAKEILQFEYDKNLYYGRLAAFTHDDLKDMLDQLLDGNYIKLVGGEYPVLRLTPQGEAAVQAKAVIAISLPRTINVGKIKQKEHERQAGGTVEYTAGLLSQGLSVEQIANQRSLSVMTIYGHVAKLIAAGRINVSAVIPVGIQTQVENAIRQVGSTDVLFPIKLLLPEEIDYNVIRCVVEDWKRKVVTTTGNRLSLEDVAPVILDCVSSLPGMLPRSGIAKLLVGSASDRIADFRKHPFFNRLTGFDRTTVMRQIDQLLAQGRLALDEQGRLTPSPSTLSSDHDVVVDFLNRAHPRQLPGPWSSGWALGFHSRFTGANWSRSEAGEFAYRVKYQNDLTALPALVEQAIALIQCHPELAQVDAVMPVPPSLSRSVNPLDVFAKTLAERLKLEFRPLLVKSRLTSPQKELHTLVQKRANVAGAFDLKSPVAGLRLLIIDDLFDSGATLEEITRFLLQTGASKVCVLTWTRTIHSDS